MLYVNSLGFGAAVRKERDRRHLSQQEAAREIGVAVRTLQGWEISDVVPHPKHRRAVIEWLGHEEEDE